MNNLKSLTVNSIQIIQHETTRVAYLGMITYPPAELPTELHERVNTTQHMTLLLQNIIPRYAKKPKPTERAIALPLIETLACLEG